MEPCATTDLALGQADANTLQLITGMQGLEQAEQLAGALHDKARVVVVYEKKMACTASDEQLTSLGFCAFVGEFQAV